MMAPHKKNCTPIIYEADSTEQQTIMDIATGKELLVEPEQHGPRRRRVRKEEPDVTIVVGGVEYRHYRQVLCFASDYFDAALNSGMKESQTLRIELPDKNPKEWELFVSFLEPLSEARISESNVETLVPWFHEFGLEALLKKCDKVYRSKVFSKGRAVEKIQTKCRRSLVEEFHFLSNVCEFSQTFGLSKARDKACDQLTTIFLDRPEIFDHDCVCRLVSLLRHQELLRDLWPIVTTAYLPRSVKQQDPELLRSNDLFADLLLSQMEKAVARNEVTKLYWRNMPRNEA